jgi:FtsP/CotA-like multicopper oxidase with cupredoxin domain
MGLCHINTTRDGIQQRKNCWQDGVLGTTCPIPPGWNWTYNFQVKDQIGSFFYFPPLGMQRAAGGFGGITVNNRAVISVPFDTPDGDITLFIGDWYKMNHTVGRGENTGSIAGFITLFYSDHGCSLCSASHL